jgi:competence protein ComEA
MRKAVSFLLALVVGVSAVACAHAGGVTDGAPAAVAPEPGAVDLNAATASDLIALPGIGPAKAEAIVAYRKKHGPFSRVDDLRKVRGFGRKTVAQLRRMVTVARARPVAPASAAVAAPASPAR